MEFTNHKNGHFITGRYGQRFGFERNPQYRPDEAVSFVDRNHDNPFFLYLAYNAPHTPLQATQKYLDRFPDLEGKRKVYAAMVSAVDDGVGESTNIAYKAPKTRDQLKQELDSWTVQLVEPRFLGLIHTEAFQQNQKKAKAKGKRK